MNDHYLFLLTQLRRCHLRSEYFIDPPGLSTTQLVNNCCCLNQIAVGVDIAFFFCRLRERKVFCAEWAFCLYHSAHTSRSKSYCLRFRARSLPCFIKRSTCFFFSRFAIAAFRVLLLVFAFYFWSRINYVLLTFYTKARRAFGTLWFPRVGKNGEKDCFARTHSRLLQHQKDYYDICLW